MSPVELAKTLWIRPEDMVKYQKIGVDVFKILGREIAHQMVCLQTLPVFSIAES